MLYLFGSYALQVGDIVKITALGIFGQHTGITAEDGIRIGDRNDNSIVFNTFKAAVEANPNTHPLFHSDRGFQYTNRTFHQMLEDAGMMQSMSRVAHCIDNGPMEGFWDILKRERYYGKMFTSQQELVQMIRDYIYYYNTQRVQRNLGVVTPMANGKVPDGTRSIKNLPRAVRSWQQKSYFISLSS